MAVVRSFMVEINVYIWKEFKNGFRNENGLNRHE